jgi:outer membrane lipoprotein carrier protein
MLKNLTLALFLGFTAWTAQAGSLETLQHFVSEVKSAKGQFVQHTERSDGRIAHKQNGDFLFSRPGRFIWSYRKPFEQILHADGERLFIWDKDLNQVTVRKLGDALTSSPAAILFGSPNLQQLFTINPLNPVDGLEWIELLPKQTDTPFKKIQIGFKDKQLSAMRLLDALGNQTVLAFNHVERNPNITTTQFKFEIPKGADVLQAGGQ